MLRRSVLRTTMGAGAMVLSGWHAARAQGAYPSRPVRVIVPFAAGGGLDEFARRFTPLIGGGIGERVIIDNRPGGNTLIATEAAARAPADGYTLLQQTNNLTINPFLQARSSVDPLRDLIPLSLVSRAPHILIVNNAVPAGTLAELVAYARSRPHALNFGSGGTGTTNHIAAELFMKATGAEMEHVPYRGASEYMNDLLGGRIQIVFAGSAQAMPLAQQGTVRALGVTGQSRLSDLPDVPTLIEAGLPVEIHSWIGYLAPAGTPEPIVSKLEEELRTASRHPRLPVMMPTQEPIGSSRAAFADFLKANLDQMGALLRTIRPSLN